MTLVWPLEADLLALEQLIAAGTVKLHLYNNNVSPGKSDTHAGATYTETSQAGYASITLTSPSYSTQGSAKQAAYAQQTFSFTTGASDTIYGYWVDIDVSGTTYYWFAEKFPAAYVIVAGSDINVTPQTTLN